MGCGGNRSINCCTRCLNNFKLNWKGKRFSWRYQWIYTRIALVLLMFLVLSFVFYGLGTNNACPDYTSCGYFANYECKKESLWFIMFSVLILTWLWLFEATISFLTSRVISPFVNHSMKDFMNTGRWGAYLGCVGKYLPWTVALLHLVWLTLCVFNIILILAVGICSNRMNDGGILAVKNCRRFYSAPMYTPPESCVLNAELASERLSSCNAMSYLIEEKFLVLDCELKSTIHICEVFNNLTEHIVGKTFVDAYETFDVGRFCLKPRPLKDKGTWYRPDDEIQSTLPPRFLDSVQKPMPIYSRGDGGEDANTNFWLELGSSSDMYRYALLWTVTSATFCVLILAILMMMKKQSPVESVFVQPTMPGEWCITRCLKAVSPFGG